MFTLKKLHAPFGTTDSPQYETSYSEGLIPVVDGFCEVRLPETRDRLIKLGYEEILPDEDLPVGVPPEGELAAVANGTGLDDPSSRVAVRAGALRRKKSKRK